MELLIDPLFDLSGMLCEEESRHCIKVMRHRAGDTVSICDGRGTLYTGRIAEADSRGCLIADIEATVMPGRGYGVHIAVAPTKNIDRLEWFVEKATELGIDRITPIVCDHSERTRLRLDRLERIATAAAKQSLKYRLPLISEPVEADRLMRRERPLHTALQRQSQAPPARRRDARDRRGGAHRAGGRLLGPRD